MDLQHVGWRAWYDLMYVRIDTGEGFCEFRNEYRGSIKSRNF
jgi:hypothetical protein